MRSKEAEKAINISKLDIVITKKQIQSGELFMIETQEKERINILETLLSYIETLEQLPNKIRDKIKELEDELELHQTYTIENDICSKLEVLKEIIGE